jgi:tetratricopeptide (TPR) repeat protein
MSTANLTKNRLFVALCFALALVTAALYWPITRNGFVNLDDEQYVTANPHVTSGLTWTNVGWAFRSSEAANWHPLTWMSHMIDCDLYGLNPGGHHLTNLLFHVANTLLLFFLLNQMTGAMWRSAFVAAFFAWHPLHVESVAWASERKDTLSTFFFLLTLMAYVRFAESSKVQSPKSKVFYILALFFFALGLMSKPVVVTLPFVLLLLDFWPLGRIASCVSQVESSNVPIFNLQPVACIRLVVEKIPFFILAAAGSVVTFLVQQNGGAISASSWGLRLENVVVAYVRYISKLFWPQNLAVVYSYPHQWPVLVAAGAALLLLTWTALTLYRARENPYLPVGWFWFLGTLVPTIGIIQVGAASIADRYTYIPSIGFFIAVVWGANDLAQRWPAEGKFLPLAGTVALIGCLGVTSIQIGYWHDSEKLFLHALDVTTDNYFVENCLGKVYEKAGRNDHALAHYAHAVKIAPRFPEAQFNLAVSLLALGQTNAALEHLRSAAHLERHDPEIEYELAAYFLHNGSPEDAERALRSALADRPDFPEAKAALDRILAAHSELKTSEPLDTAR